MRHIELISHFMNLLATLIDLYIKLADHGLPLPLQ